MFWMLFSSEVNCVTDFKVNVKDYWVPSVL